MRVTVSHNKSLDEAKRVVNDYADQIFNGMPGSPLQIVEQQKRWDGSTMHFSFTGRVGIFTAPIKGYVSCTQKDVTVDVTLPGALQAMFPEDKLKQQLEGRVRGLLK